jgi:hypothetical protein
MSKAQRFRWLGLPYGAMAVLGAAYGVFEQQHAVDRLADSMKELSLPLMKEILPFSLLLILAHSTLHRNYGKARVQTV